MKERRHEEQSIDDVRERDMGRLPKAGEAENYAATGIFQPSENPRLGSRLSTQVQKMQGGLTQLQKELNAQQDTAAERKGKVQLPDRGGPRDLIVGPDIGQRPHRPLPPSRRR